MPTIQTGPLPAHALLQTYLRSGAFTDCYFTDVPSAVPLATFIEAFYTGRLFRVERFILHVALKRPSTDEQVRELAAGRIREFAAWSVEGREEDQVLLCDMAQRTRSWLMVEPLQGGAGTRLYFGSAVVPVVDRKSGQARMGALFHLLLGFHAWYSRALLAAARRGVMKG